MPPPLTLRRRHGVRAATTHDDQVISRHGKVTLSRVVQSGEQVGYIITCRCHHNVGEDEKENECKKTLTFGVTEPILSHAECIRRLKNWVILGNDPTLQAGWEASGTARSCHVFDFGGKRLHELSSDDTSLATYGYTDEELDYACARLE